jgi:formyl-CoA transferase
MMIGIANDNLWRRFCRAVGREELIDDPRFQTNPDRVANFDATVGLVQDIVRTRPRDAWLTLLTGIGVPCAPINTLAEMLGDPHTTARGIVVDYDHPTLGPMQTIAQPIVFNGATRTVRSAPPLHGEQTRQVLRATGYTDEEIHAMERDGVVYAADCES